MHNIVISYLHKRMYFSGEIIIQVEPNGGSKNVKRGPLISIKFVPRGPYFSKNLDGGGGGGGPNLGGFKSVVTGALQGKGTHTHTHHLHTPLISSQI